MKSDLLCQEASASSPAAPSGETGKTIQGKAHSWGSCHPWPHTGAPVGSWSRRAQRHRGEHREQLPGGSVGQRGPSAARSCQGRGCSTPSKTSPGCIFRQQTWRNFFFFSFASKPWLSSEPCGTRRAPCPAPAPLWVLVGPH